MVLYLNLPPLFPIFLSCSTKRGLGVFVFFLVASIPVAAVKQLLAGTVSLIRV